MFKILIVSTFYWPHHVGGAEISTRLLAEGLAKNGNFSVDIFTHGINGEDVEMVHDVRVIRHEFPMLSAMLLNSKHRNAVQKVLGKVLDLRSSPKRKRFYHKLFSQYDIVLISGNATKMGYRDMWKAAQSARIPLVHIIRDPALLYISRRPCRIKIADQIYRKISTSGIKNVKYAVGITDWIIQQHIFYGIRLNHYDVIYNPFDESMCSALSYDEKKDIILFVGEISCHKGCHTLIKAFQNIEQQIPSFKLLLVGKKLDVDIPDDERIVAVGHLDLINVYQYMCKAKLLVLPSEWDEAFGRVLVESVFNGTIAIGSSRGGIPEVFQYDKRFIFEAGNAQTLAQMLLKYAALDKKEYDLALHELRELFQRYRYDHIIDLWTKYLQSILEK